MKKAIYPGSFDPLSNGHLDIIQRAADIFETIHVVVSYNNNKKTILTVEERVKMIKKATKQLNNVFVTSYDGLIVNYAKDNHIDILIRGLRNYQDYEQEFSLFQYNKEINPDIETLIMFPSSKHLFVSSSAIRELITFDCDISKYVPLSIKDDIIKTFKS